MREILILILLAYECPSAVAVCGEQVGVKRKAVFDSIFPLSTSGFSVSTAGRMHIFKPVSVQAMWYVRGWAPGGRDSSFCQYFFFKNQLHFSLLHDGYLVSCSRDLFPCVSRGAVGMLVPNQDLLLQFRAALCPSAWGKWHQGDEEI